MIKTYIKCSKDYVYVDMSSESLNPDVYVSQNKKESTVIITQNRPFEIDRNFMFSAFVISSEPFAQYSGGQVKK